LDKEEGTDRGGESEGAYGTPHPGDVRLILDGSGADEMGDALIAAPSRQPLSDSS